ncbi:MAG: hypothetical protein MI743_12235 [Sneathiellales bacterium]|nr:hypothetical protein [Sneathiellales bacterium]
MLKKYKEMPSSDKTKIIVIIGVMMMAGYFGLWYPSLSDEVAFQENMVNRRLNRMETRLKKVEEPTESAAKLEKQLKALEDNHTQLRKQMEFLSEKFIPLDKPNRLKNMRLEVSQLAAKAGMDIDQIRSALSGDPQAAPPTAEIIELESKNRFGRPLISLRAKSDFNGLMQFLQGLRNFSSNISVVRLAMEADRSFPDAEDEQQQANLPQLLDVELILAM